MEVREPDLTLTHLRANKLLTSMNEHFKSTYMEVRVRLRRALCAVHSRSINKCLRELIRPLY